MKNCAGCQTKKELEEFGKNKNTPDGKNVYCKICARERDRASHFKHREKRLLKIKNYGSANKERLNEYQLKRHHLRMETDSMYVLKKRYRSRTRKLFREKNIIKVTSSMEFLGCTAEEFKTYFESLFTEGMSWELFYEGKIHIDHIKPISLAQTEEDLIKLSHYTNLQPLWAIDNLKKGKL